MKYCNIQYSSRKSELSPTFILQYLANRVNIHNIDATRAEDINFCTSHVNRLSLEPRYLNRITMHCDCRARNHCHHAICRIFFRMLCRIRIVSHIAADHRHIIYAVLCRCVRRSHRPIDCYRNIRCCRITTIPLIRSSRAVKILIQASPDALGTSKSPVEAVGSTPNAAHIAKSAHFQAITGWLKIKLSRGSISS